MNSERLRVIKNLQDNLKEITKARFFFSNNKKNAIKQNLKLFPRFYLIN